MPAGVTRWTGREARLLRLALRKNNKQFAAMVGISTRQLTTWEQRGETLFLHTANQLALDTILSRADPAAQERFATLLTERAAVEADERVEELLSSRAHIIKHPVDNKLMVLVEEGVYLSGPDNRSVWLDGYLIDVYPTTNRDYAQFVKATGHPPPQHWPGGRCPTALADHPVVWVSWHDANAYARWAGKELPSSPQWEKAARGTKGRVVPWGDVATAAKCNTAEAEIGATTPVSRYQSGVSPHGCYDMIGNVWEWCSTQATDGPDRYELKGSAFTSPLQRSTPWLRNAANVRMKDNDTGFRCVKQAQAGGIA